MAKSPAIEGLRLVYRQPAVGFAEVTWRWTFALATWLLLCSLVLEYLDSLTVTRGDLLLLRSGVPWLMLATIQHIVLSGVRRFAVAGVLVISAAGALWIFAASVGRAATLKALLGHFEYLPGLTTVLDASAQTESASIHARLWSPFRALLGLHFLRAGLLMATVLGLMGAARLSGFASSDSDPHPALVFVLFLGLACLIALLFGVLDWLLSIASIFAIRDWEDTFGCVSACVDFVRKRLGPVVGASAIFALIHGAVLFASVSIAPVVMLVLGVVPAWIKVAVILMLVLLYFAFTDFLYVARLDAYVCILEQPDESHGPLAISVPPENLNPPKASPADEDDILSDIPGIVPPPKPA